VHCNPRSRTKYPESASPSSRCSFTCWPQLPPSPSARGHSLASPPRPPPHSPGGVRGASGAAAQAVHAASHGARRARTPPERCASPRPARLARCSAAALVGPRGDCCCPCRLAWPCTCPAATCRALVRRQQGGRVAGRMEQGGRGEQQAAAQGYTPPTCVGRDLGSPCDQLRNTKWPTASCPNPHPSVPWRLTGGRAPCGSWNCCGLPGMWQVPLGARRRTSPPPHCPSSSGAHRGPCCARWAPRCASRPR